MKDEFKDDSKDKLEDASNDQSKDRSNDVPGARDLFERYLANECSPEEVRRLLHEGESFLKDYLQTYLDADARVSIELPSQSDVLLEEAYNRIRERIGLSIPEEARPAIRRIGLARRLSVAAILLLLIIGAGLYL